MGVKSMFDYTPDQHSLRPDPPTVSSVRILPRPLPQPHYTRIDFFQINVGIALGLHEIKWGWRVSKYIDGWTAGTAPHTVEDDPPMRSADGTEEPFDIDKALDPPRRPRLDRPPLAIRPLARRTRLAGITAACAQSSTDQPDALRPDPPSDRHAGSHHHLDPGGSRL